jgi:hypothetical protein
MMRELPPTAGTVPGSTTASNLVPVAIAQQQLQLFRSIPEVTNKDGCNPLCVRVSCPGCIYKMLTPVKDRSLQSSLQ